MYQDKEKAVLTQQFTEVDRAFASHDKKKAQGLIRIWSREHGQEEAEKLLTMMQGRYGRA